MYQAIITYGVKLWDGVSYRWYCRDAWGRCLQMFTYSVLVCDILDIAYLHQLCQLLYKFRLQIWEIHHEAWSICVCTDLRSWKKSMRTGQILSFLPTFSSTIAKKPSLVQQKLFRGASWPTADFRVSCTCPTSQFYANMTGLIAIRSLVQIFV